MLPQCLPQSHHQPPRCISDTGAVRDATHVHVAKGVKGRVLSESDLKAAARRGPTGKLWAQMFSVGFGNLCPTYGVKLLPINETSRIFTTLFLR